MRTFNFTLKKQDFWISISETSSWLVFHDWFPMKISLVWWEINTNYEISRVNQKKIKSSRKEYVCERALNFDQWKTFSEKHKPVRVWFWLVYKFIENYCRSWLSSEFVQTQKRYPTSFDIIRILTWKLLVISS